MIISNQGSLTLSVNRRDYADQLVKLVPKIEATLPKNFPPYRRFEIVSPSLNTPFEPRKFSSKHSEFMLLKAYGLHELNTNE